MNNELFHRKLKEYTKKIKNVIKNDDADEFTKIYEERVKFILDNMEGLFSEEFENVIETENEIISNILDEKQKVLSNQIMESEKENQRRKAYAMYE